MTYNTDTADVEPLSDDEWLDIMLEAGTDEWGDDITDRQGTFIEALYRPLAEQLADLNGDLGSVLDSTRLNDATGQELDYRGEELGVSRRPARKATGVVTLSRDITADKEYSIQKGIEVQTGGPDGSKFITTEQVTLASGTSSVDAKIAAQESGSQGNVAADAISEFEGTAPTGVTAVTNANATSGGRKTEPDDNYRSRIKTRVGEIDVSSGQRIYNLLTNLKYVYEVRYFDNSSNVADNNLNAHEAEVVVDAEAGHSDEIAQTIFDNIPMGCNLVSGAHGTASTGAASLENGQTFTIDYTVPTEVQIYVDIAVEVSESIDKADIKNAIVEYIGGVKTFGNRLYGELSVSEDVIFGEVEYQIRSVDNVYDVTNLEIGTSADPTGTTNIAIASSEVARVDVSNITITTTQV